MPQYIVTSHPDLHNPTLSLYITFSTAELQALIHIADSFGATPHELLTLCLSEIVSIAKRAHQTSKEPAL